jgi:hypothetical protein
VLVNKIGSPKHVVSGEYEILTVGMIAPVTLIVINAVSMQPVAVTVPMTK